MKIPQLVTVLLLLSTLASAYNTISEENIQNKTYERYYLLTKTIHLGDNINPQWENPNPEKYFETKFDLLGQVAEAQVFMDLFQTDNDCDPVKINGVEIGKICVNHENDWRTCSLTIPRNLLRKGENTIRVETCTADYVNYDDFQLDNMYLLSRYSDLNPRIIATKILSDYEASPNESVNVTVIITNLGIKNAYNITVVDFIPSKADLTSGSRTHYTGILKNWETDRYQYTIVADRIGELNSTEGVIAYRDDRGNDYAGTIEMTQLRIVNPAPKIILIKNISKTSLLVGEKADITIHAVNDGKFDAFNVFVEDYLDKGLNVTSGLPVRYYAILPKNSSVSYSYTFQATAPVELSSRALATYSDRQGKTYEKASNYVPISVKQKASSNSIISADTLLKLLAIVAVAIIILYVLYTRYG